MIKAAFFDIDGTLLSFKTHRVSEGTQRAFEKLRKQNIKTFIATGRPKIIIPPMPIQFDGYVTMNGALCWVGNQVVYSAPMDKCDSQRWLRYCKEHQVVNMSITRDKMYGNRMSDVVVAIHEQLDFEIPPVVDEDSIMDEEFYQFIGIMPAEEDAKVAELLPNCSLPRWHPTFTDIVKAGGNKSVGIQHVLEHYGFTPKEIIAFGDGGNDVEMLEYAGIGVAMGNADESVKRRSDFVTTDVDHEGIEYALTQLGII